MTRFLFWNMGRKSLEESLFRLAHNHRVDVLLLAEMGLPAGQILEEVLNRDEVLYFAPATPKPAREKVRIFTRFEGELLRHEENHAKFRWTISQLELPGVEAVLVVAVHLDSKMVYNPDSQSSVCRDLAEQIRQVETRLGHRRTLVIGDFNLNPFETGLVGLKNLNAEPTRLKAQNKIRIENRQEFTYFYNPMWNFFGDETRGPAGTFYFNSFQPVRMGWNMLDQLLLRPALLRCFDIERLQILEGDGVNSFLTRDTKIPRGRKNNAWSDHLPILFDLDL